MPATREPNQLEPIHHDRIYPLPVFQRAAGLGVHALREMRKRGLKTIRSGGRVFVRGEDFFAFMVDEAEK